MDVDIAGNEKKEHYYCFTLLFFFFLRLKEVKKWEMTRVFFCLFVYLKVKVHEDTSGDEETFLPEAQDNSEKNSESHSARYFVFLQKGKERKKKWSALWYC